MVYLTTLASLEEHTWQVRLLQNERLLHYYGLPLYGQPRIRFLQLSDAPVRTQQSVPQLLVPRFHSSHDKVVVGIRKSRLYPHSTP